jgi:acyl-CoA reductase-like NAD-dependent aldehyde dehydrogenase
VNVSDSVTKFLDETPLPLWIGGQSRHSLHDLVADVIAPATGRPVASAANAGHEDVAEAVDAASDAFPGWSALAGAERAARLRRLADLLDRHRATIAMLETLDVGKPLRDAEGFDVPFGTDAYRYFAGLAERDADSPLDVPGLEAIRHGLPRGVCALIHPWNAPYLLGSWSIAPALAAGNTVVLKPSELTPLSSLYVARLTAEAGFPDGVFNVVPGDGATCGEVLIGHPDVAMISFTGSPETGRRIATVAAENFVPTKLELGGKGAALVFDDVDLQATAAALVDAITLNAGQVCCTATRWIMHEKVFHGVAEDAERLLRGITVGPGEDERSDMGPVISRAARNRVLALLQAGLNGGARFLAPSGAVEVAGAEGGYYVAPGLMTGPENNVCARREIFGPIAYLMPFRTEDEGIRLANATRYGLANSVWSADLERAHRVARRLRSGTTWINSHNVFSYGLRYGGIKHSGWGGGVNSADTYRDYQHVVTIARAV